jgi:hypothetical protein
MTSILNLFFDWLSTFHEDIILGDLRMNHHEIRLVVASCACASVSAKFDNYIVR